MVILIGNLPKLAAETDLCQLLSVPTGARIRIVKEQGRDGVIRRYALVPVRNEQLGAKLIARIQGMQWRGQTLVAHEFQHRTGANERRRIDWRSVAWIAAERRLEERRHAAAGVRSRVA